jgi:hypothetical protein
MRRLALLLLFAVSLHADDRLGTIRFPNSGKPDAQPAFLRGVLLLHNFAYPQAASAFVEAQKIDPNFVLAYWGESMTSMHPLWYEGEPAAGRAALAKIPAAALAAATPRERAYVEAVRALVGSAPDNEPAPRRSDIATPPLQAARNVRYEAAMAEVANAHPDDVEAQVFHALSILGAKPRGDLDPRSGIRAAAILETLLPAHADHPGVLHYMIHAYDDPLHAPLGLRAAQRYATVASAAPHAVHMPSHIFLQLGMWSEAAKSNEAAYALSKEWGSPDYHSLEWLQYVYLQQHRIDDAKKLIDEVHGAGERYDHARMNMKIRYAIESGDWDAFDFAKEHDAPAVLFARGLQALAKKKLDDADAAVSALATSAAKPQREVWHNELLAAIAAARGNAAEQRRLLQAAIAAEELIGVPSGPPDDFKPAHELLGEALLKSGNAKGAAEEFRQSLLRTPNRAASVAGAKAAEAALH